AEDGIRDFHVTGVQTCALPILPLLDQVVDAQSHRLSMIKPDRVTVHRDVAVEDDDWGDCLVDCTDQPRLFLVARRNDHQIDPPRSVERRAGKEWSPRRAAYQPE